MPLAFFVVSFLIIFCVSIVAYFVRRSNVERRVRQKSMDQLRCHEVRFDNYNEGLHKVKAAVECDFSLQESEVVFYRDRATLIWDDGEKDVFSASPVTKSKTSGGALGATIGGLALGPVGAVAGYALSQKKTTTTTIAPTLRVTDKKTDPGYLTVTNRRMVFIGERGSTLVAPLDEILQISALETGFANLPLPRPYFEGRQFGQNEIRFRRAESLPNERFIVRNLAYFMMAMREGGRSEIAIPERPVLPD